MPYIPAMEMPANWNYSKENANELDDVLYDLIQNSKMNFANDYGVELYVRLWAQPPERT